VKQRDLARHLTALRVGEFEVATGGGIWVAIRDKTQSGTPGREHYDN
jgi:hypothetical protein